MFLKREKVETIKRGDVFLLARNCGETNDHFAKFTPWVFFGKDLGNKTLSGARQGIYHSQATYYATSLLD